MLTQYTKQQQTPVFMDLKYFGAVGWMSERVSSV